MADVVHALAVTQWSLFFLNLTSSYGQWGLGHLDRDTDEISLCANYIIDYKKAKHDSGKLVLMGHSTGSQAVLHYLHRPNPHHSLPTFDPSLEHISRPVLDGAIMQAPVSDREAIMWVLKQGIGGKTPGEMQETYLKLNKLAQDAERGDRTTDSLLPLALTGQIYPGAPISSRRWLSLVSPDSPQAPTEDDLFSSDLSDEQLSKTFGIIKSRGLLKGKLVVLFSGADQSVPNWVDKEQLLLRWKNATDKDGGAHIWDSDHSAIIPGASHALSNSDQAEPRRYLVNKVIGYLNTL